MQLNNKLLLDVYFKSDYEFGIAKLRVCKKIIPSTTNNNKTLHFVVFFFHFAQIRDDGKSFPIHSARAETFIISKYDEVNTVFYIVLLSRALHIVSHSLHLFTSC